MSQIKNLYRDYGEFKVDIPLWDLPDTGISALLGPSGSGKTSIFRLLIGLEPCPSLSWILNGTDLAKLPISKRRLGVVFQSLELFPHLTTEENIRFAERARRVDPIEADKLRDEVVQILRLERVLRQKVATLSGGEKQRVAIARALAGRPQFLFLDEPFSSIDEELRQESRTLVKKTVEVFNIPTLIVTHDPRDVRELGAQVFRIEDGSLKT